MGDQALRELELAARKGDKAAAGKLAALNDRFFTREITLGVRAVDAETVEFVAASEEVVDMGWYREVLRMKGADLKRFRSNPVILNTHSRWDVDDIVGRAVELKIEEPSEKGGKRKLVTKIAFSEATEKGRTTKALVQEGSLRTLSIGYRVKKGRYLEENEVDGEGEDEVRGPCYVAQKWELLEISVVPVPADASALKRAYGATNMEEGRMADSSKDAGATPAEGTRAPTAGTSSSPAPDAGATPAPDVTPLDEVQARQIEARKRLILSFTPAELRDEAEELVLREPNVTVEKARAHLLQKLTERLAPVGTPEPEQPKRTSSPAGQPAPAKDVKTGGDVVRALGGVN